MAETEEIEILGMIPMTANLPPWQFEAIAEHVEPLKLKKGARLIECGSDDGFTYFLTAGKVSLECADNPPMVVEASAESVRTPIANLRPRIVDVTALERIRVIRVPDILLNAIECGHGKTDSEETAGDAEGQEERRNFETRLPFQLYRDLKNSESSILPSLPDTAVRIQLAIEDDLSDADAVARLVVADPAIATKLVKTANSALYGGRSPVTALTAAVVRLGMQTTRNLVLTFALKEVFRTKNKLLRQRMKDLWEHSAYIAATCFVLAREVEGVNPEEALLVGLVHDIGAIAVINYATRDPQRTADLGGLEQTISCMRGELGALILRRWKFAPTVAVAVRDAETWMREHDGVADFTDLLIVAQVHERLRKKETDGLPRIEDIPAFAKVLGQDASPHKSLVILHQAEIMVDQMRSVLRR
ncbi:MAG: HDOD domain-containing protein [Sedimenticolaceae bacterium]